MNAIENDTAIDAFLEPALLSLEKAASRDCPRISDRDFLRAAIRRVLEKTDSGRDFIQRCVEVESIPYTVSNYFEGLKSKRRAAMLAEVCRLVCEMEIDADDPLSSIAELEGRPVWAADGHMIEHACHAPSDWRGKSYATNVIYGIDLRTDMAKPLCLAGNSSKKEHEVKAFKRERDAFIKPASKPIWVLDPAYVDNYFWLRQKMVNGVYFVTRMKRNMKPISRIAVAFDASDPINRGVLEDLRIGVDNVGMMRLVRYEDQASGSIHQFLTSEMTLRPGVVAYLYQLRWRIEKTFDTFENSLGESKSWANSDNARIIQSLAICLTHNLMTLFQDSLKRDKDLSDSKLLKKKRAAVEATKEMAKQRGRDLPPLVGRLLKPSQISLQFIRWLRNQWTIKDPYDTAIERLRPLMDAYL